MSGELNVRPYQICSFCVMDTSNPFIEFDATGQCDCCRDALARLPTTWFPNERGALRLDQLAAQLRSDGSKGRYDAMIGLSGGVDSAYLAHLSVRRLGLRVLAVHVDGGWNSEPAVSNIERIVRANSIDLYTHVVEWGEMRSLQCAFLRAGVLNQDIPQDHAFFSSLYRTAARFGIRNFLSGVNFASESIVARKFGHSYMDARHIQAINRRFNGSPLLRYCPMSMFEYLWLTQVGGSVRIHKPLDLIPYSKSQAESELKKHYGWRDYGMKHSESRFTKFYQDIYLPRKHKFDKRRLHLSSLIVAGELTRPAALKELERPVIEPGQAKRDLKFVAKKLGMSTHELDTLIDSPSVSHENFPSNKSAMQLIQGLKPFIQRLRFSR